MTRSHRFLLVTLVGAVTAALIVALLAMAGLQLRVVSALPLALTAPVIQLLDDQLVTRQTKPVATLAQGVMSGVVAWIVFGWVAR